MSNTAHDHEWVRKPDSASKGTNCTAVQYEEMYARSIEKPDEFWAE